LEVTQAEPAAPSEATTGDDRRSKPFMVNITTGLYLSLARAFVMAGWRTFAVDLLFGEEHDISKPSNQVTIKKQFMHTDFIWAAIDCSVKSRIRKTPVERCLTVCVGRRIRRFPLSGSGQCRWGNRHASPPTQCPTLST